MVSYWAWFHGPCWLIKSTWLSSERTKKMMTAPSLQKGIMQIYGSDKSKITETKMESFEADCTIDRSVFLLAWPPIFCFFLCWYGYGSKLTGWDLRHLLSRGSKVLLGTKCLGDLRGEMVWQVQATRKGVVVTYTNKDWTTWNGYSD